MSYMADLDAELRNAGIDPEMVMLDEVTELQESYLDRTGTELGFTEACIMLYRKVA
jgi:hypothetical protein